MEVEMCIRGIRGATVADADEAQAILVATQELLLAILEANPTLRPEDLASILFTMTDDLSATYPAMAARQLSDRQLSGRQLSGRQLGWTQVPLLCAQEIPVPGGQARCIRVLLHWNTSLPQSAVQHVYLKDAARLRPDLNGHHPERLSEPTLAAAQ